jgi:hypothetical protein
MAELNNLVIDNIVTNSLKLRSPKGNVMNTPIYNAFNKDSLGSIPTDSEIILFKDKQFQEKKGFLSQEYRFNRFGMHKNISPGPCEYNTPSVNTSQSFLTKGYGNVFTSKSVRFDDKKEFYEKFYPGPTDYNNNNFTINKSNDKSIKYGSLYYPQHAVKMKLTHTTPGPGYYKISNANSNKYSLHSVFVSKYKRNIVREFDYESEPAKYNQELPFVKNADKPSYFFRVQDVKNSNPIEKVLCIDKKEFKIPSVGYYDITKQWPKVKSSFDVKRSFEEKLKEDSELKERFEKMNKKVVKPKKIRKCELFAFVDDGIAKNSAGYVFESHTKRLRESNNHIPGPCYYKDIDKLPNKAEFRYKNNNIWV